ncbi:MAG: cell wall hydrolase [Alphaproteobacteria bacterium]|nr:cell wall hydrolase [Alphaproteobacteria bacterium]
MLKINQNKKQNAVDTLAKTIFNEAGGSNIHIMEAIASVVVNHASQMQGYDNSTDLQDAIVDACTTKSSCDIDDIDEKEPSQDDEMQERLYQSCRRIAKRALAGNLEDATNGAIKYHASSEYPEWAKAVPPSVCIGNYLFYE